MSKDKKDVLRPTDAEAIALARKLLRTARHGAIAVLDPESGAPVASRVAVATDFDGAPIILVSALSAHTAGLMADPRCSLLLGEPGKGHPLAHPRISVACTATRLAPDDERRSVIESRFLNRHPKARLYAGFGDFSYFRLEPVSASLNGGFGKAYVLKADELLLGVLNKELEAIEPSAVEHMNADHADAVSILARASGGVGGGGDWRLTGIDAEGFDLIGNDDCLRILFPEPLATAGDLRSVLAGMTDEGRGRLAEK
ncbi:MAG: HugZ family protein [Rhizobiaceae bacterium]|nr:HugZ family protein [Rhizobiaceae bacterium]